jgi:hypothetical protein
LGKGETRLKRIVGKALKCLLYKEAGDTRRSCKELKELQRILELSLEGAGRSWKEFGAAAGDGLEQEMLEGAWQSWRRQWSRKEVEGAKEACRSWKSSVEQQGAEWNRKSLEEAEDNRRSCKELKELEWTWELSY